MVVLWFVDFFSFSGYYSSSSLIWFIKNLDHYHIQHCGQHERAIPGSPKQTG